MYIGARPETRLMYMNSLSNADLIYATPNVEGFYASNITTTSRTALYIPQNMFTIDSSNDTFNISVGVSGKLTITLIHGDYTGENLASHMQLRFSHNYVITYHSTTRLFGFRNTANPFILYLSDHPSSWDTVGFPTGTTFEGDTNLQYYSPEPRMHSQIHLQFDLGGSADCSFFALLGERNKSNSLSSNASIVLKLSNINDVNSATSVTITPTVNGCFSFLDGIINEPKFRYMWLFIKDPKNTNEFISFSQLFLGGFTSWENRTINHGFTVQYIDRSVRTESISGALFFERYNKYPYLTNLKLSYLTREQVSDLQQAWFDLGKSEHLYMSLDSGHMNNDLSQWMYFGVFDSEPTIEEVNPRLFNASFSFRGD